MTDDTAMHKHDTPASPQPTQQQAVEALFERGFALHQQGQLAQAKTAYEEVLQQQPAHSEALHLLGALAMQSNNPAQAVELMGKAIAINPNFILAHANLASALMKLNRLEEAVSSCERAIALKPDYAEAWCKRGLALHKLQRLEPALASFDHAIALKPDYADAWSNRGMVQHELDQWDAALSSFNQALTLQPDSANTHFNLEEALESYDRAIAINPCSQAMLHSNRGRVLHKLQQLEQAASSYDQAIALDANFWVAYYNKSLVLLLGGQFGPGWELYEWRWKRHGGLTERQFTQPIWTGAECLSGKTILLHGEQGFGDRIQFCRYAKLVKQLGAMVLLEVSPELSALLQGLEGVDRVLEYGQPLPAFDYHCPLLSLPRACKTELHTIPRPDAYLRCDAGKHQQWQQRLAEKTRPRIGLAWRGRASHKDDQNRSLPLAAWLPHLPKSIDYVSLQKEVSQAERELLRSCAIPHFGELLHDFSDTAALCDWMDLVLTVDSSVAHLAAAMGKPTWIVLPYAPDWRWLLNRADSPWYPSVKLYRQTEPGQWGPVLARVADDLLQVFAPVGKPLFVLPAEQVEAVFEHGFQLHQKGQLAQARAAYEEVLRMQPRHCDALHLLGAIAIQSRDPARAVELMGKAVEINPRFVEAHTNLAAALMEINRPLEALTRCNQAIAIRPDYADAHSNRGLALQQLQRLEEALNSYDQALALKPDHVDAHCNRGTVLVELHRLDEALRSYDQAIAIDPACVEAFCNRGIARKKRHHYAAALADYEQALAIAPRHLKSHFNRGLVLQNMQRLQEAMDSFDQAIAIRPDYMNAYFSKSLTCLLAGQLQQGWKLYESRWQYDGGFSPRPFAQAQWSGAEKLLGKTILLHAEQGLGDCLQFCRYAKLVKSRGARVLLEVPPPLTSLLANLEGVDAVLTKGQPLPAFDCHCPLLSLPLAFQTGLDSIPSPGAYVQSSASQRHQWSQRLGAKTRPRVGLVWTGSTLHKDDQNRSLPLTLLLHYLPASVDYVSLQKEVSPADRELLRSSAIPHFGELLHDFSDTAALCELMDVVLSVDTSVAHLVAAMGKSTWIVLPYAPDWRWLLNRDDSPWYASARLFRQTEPGQWGAVLGRVAKDLASLG